jgi:hypothetical protein
MKTSTWLLIGAAAVAYYLYVRNRKEANAPIKKLTAEQQKSVQDIVNTAKSGRLI